MSVKTAAVLVVNYHSSGRVADLLTDLAGSDAPEQLIISIADNSTDATEQATLQRLAASNRESFADIVVSDVGANLGYAGGNNAAYKAVQDADFDVVIVCNPDIRLADGSLRALINASPLSSVGITVPQTSENGWLGDGRAAINLLTGKSRKLAPGESAGRRWLTYPGGHFTLFSRDLWARIGGLSEDFFLYSEEADVVLRAQINADERVTSTALTVEHDSGGTTGSQSGSRSRTTLFHAARSSIILFRKHRRLRRTLPAVVLSRLMFALIITLRRGPGSVVVAGILSGVRFPLKRRATA